MAKKLFATLIFKIKHADYLGNNHFTMTIGEQIDLADCQIEGGLTFKSEREQMKISLDISCNYSETKHIGDEDDATDYIFDKIADVALPSPDNILFMEDKSELNILISNEIYA